MDGCQKVLSPTSRELDKHNGHSSLFNLPKRAELTARPKVFQKDVTLDRKIFYKPAENFNLTPKQKAKVHSLSAFLRSHVNSHALLVPRYTSEPRAHAIFVQLAPNTHRVACLWCFNFDDLGSEVSMTETLDSTSLFSEGCTVFTRAVAHQTAPQCTVRARVLVLRKVAAQTFGCLRESASVDRLKGGGCQAGVCDQQHVADCIAG